MKLLALPTALIVAAVAVPLLLLLYFLKLRRQERKVSSTLLWKKAVQDLQVNAPFQKLRKNLLLFLQLLLLLAVLLGLAHPVSNFTRAPKQSVVLLLDTSGSMQASESNKRTRLDEAKDAAARFISELPDASRAMVISFADRARVECSFTSDKRRLKHSLEDIEPTCGGSRLGEALQLAVAYSSSLIEEANIGVPEAAKQGAADIELFSDGNITDAGEQFVTRGHMRYFKIGAASDNVGIVAFDVRRDFERPGHVSVFVRVENFNSSAVRSDVSLSLDGKLLTGAGSIREIVLGPANDPTSRSAGSRDSAASGPRGAAPESNLPASQNVVFELQHDAGGVLEVTWHRPDALDLDNRVVAPLDPPRPVRLLVVCGRPEVRALLSERRLQALGAQVVEFVTPAEYEAMPEARIVTEGRCAYDLVLLDNHDTDRLPPGHYVFFNGLPRIDGVSRGEDVVAKPIVYGAQHHPLMRSVNFDAIAIAQWKRLKLPSHALPLLEGEESTVLALLADPGHRYVISAFDLLDSDFLFEPSFPVFLQNAIMFLAGGGIIEAGRMISSGDTVTLPVPPAARKLRITRPDGVTETLDVGERANVSYARTQDVGLYRARFDDEAGTAMNFAVNLLDRVESAIRPNDSLAVGSERVATMDAATKINEALWPYAVAAALVLLLVEWWVYNRRVMI